MLTKEGKRWVALTSIDRTRQTGGVPKNYTRKLSKKDKKKQIKSIQKSIKAYKKGKYIDLQKSC